MSPTTAQATHTVEDFVDFLRALDDEGIEYAIIGGCAVGAYARLRGETVVSADLDIYVRATTLSELLAWATTGHAEVVSRPQPRSVPVAVLKWGGQEINVLTASDGLPPPDVVLRTAREFELEESGLAVLIADPIDILANKLAIKREKDLPHIELLRRFLYEEVVDAFGSEPRARDALEPARRLLTVLQTDVLPSEIAVRLTRLATDPVRRRFLAHRIEDPADLAVLAGLATSDEERNELDAIIAVRRGEA
jgi:hypothetical protein